MKPTAETRDVSELTFDELIRLLAHTDRGKIDLRWRMTLIQSDADGKLHMGFSVTK